MKDRIAEHPGRVRLTPVAGQSNVYDMTREDSPIEVGTPINKATLLTDAVAAKLGLNPANNPTVNDALNCLLPAQIVVYGASDVAPTCTKGTLSAIGTFEDGVWFFTIPEYGDWTVAVQGGYSETIRIDDCKQYYVYLADEDVKYTMLYDYGDECTDITGGWIKRHSERVHAFSKQNHYIALGARDPADWEHVAYVRGGNNTAIAIPENSIAYILYELESLSGGSPVSEAVRLYLSNGDNNGVTPSTDQSQYAVKNLELSQTYTLAYVERNAQSTNVSVQVQSSYSPHTGDTTVYMYACFFTADDDWKNLCRIATGTAPNTLDELIADTDKLSIIFDNHIAVIFMLKRCLGNFMGRVIADDSARAVLQDSQYYTLIQANEHWAKFLAMVA